ncbi:hypothetical protein [Streptosporangium sp. NPDC087985]
MRRILREAGLAASGEQAINDKVPVKIHGRGDGLVDAADQDRA